MATLPTTPKGVPLILSSKSAPILTAAHVKAFARQKGAKRIADVDALANTFFGPVRKLGYNPDALSAMSDLETGHWSSDAWLKTLNPGGIGIFPDGSTQGIGFDDGEDAAWAMTVHFMAYARGFDNKLAKYLTYDPRYIEVLKKGWGKSVGSLEGFGGDNGGKWATDSEYSAKAFGRLLDIYKAIKTPTPTPTPTDAPLPSNIVQKSTGNFFPNRHGRGKPIAIVYHITDDMVLDNTLSWFANPSSQASSHAVIARDGTIYQFVSSLDAAWTNGDTDHPRADLPLLQWALNQGGNLNDFTLTIEHVGTPENPPTDAQYKSSIALSAYWRDRYSIRPSRGHMWRHADINSIDRPYCPGPHFDLARIITALGGDPADMAA